MTMNEFIELATKEGLKVLERSQDGNAILIENEFGTKFTLIVEALQNDLDQLLGCLHEKRDIVALVKMTRICGYFSRLANWNRSKLAELRARRAGRYAIEPEQAVQHSRVQQAVKA